MVGLLFRHLRFSAAFSAAALSASTLPAAAISAIYSLTAGILAHCRCRSQTLPPLRVRSIRCVDGLAEGDSTALISAVSASGVLVGMLASTDEAAPIGILGDAS